MYSPPQAARILPRDLDLISRIPGILAVARDQDLRLIWCTPSLAEVSHLADSVEDLVGTTLYDLLTESAAKERETIHRRVMETGEILSHYQLSEDSRVMCTIFPLDKQAFGHKGVLAVVKDAPVNTRLFVNKEIKVLSSPNLHHLEALSQRELEILHHIAKGLATSDIADHLCRSTKTIENHVNAIHTKLGTHSRPELVRYTSERGIQSFTEEEWMGIVRGAKVVRKEIKEDLKASESNG